MRAVTLCQREAWVSDCGTRRLVGRERNQKSRRLAAIRTAKGGRAVIPTGGGRDRHGDGRQADARDFVAVYVDLGNEVRIHLASRRRRHHRNYSLIELRTPLPNDMNRYKAVTVQ